MNFFSFPKLLAAIVAFSLWAVGASAGFSAPAATTQKWDQLMTDSVRALKSNQLARAVSLCDEAQQLATDFGPNDTHLARSQVLRAEIYMWEKKNDLAEKTLLEAGASCEKAVGASHPDIVHPLSSLANFYYYVVPQYEKVAALFTRILEIVDHTPGRDDHQVIMWCRNLGMIYQQLGQFDRAEPLFKRAVAISEHSAPEWLSHELLNQAAFYRGWEHFEAATACANRALALREKALAADRDNVDAKLDVAVALDECGLIDLNAGRLKEAEATCRRSLALVESFMTRDQPDLTPRLVGLAVVLQARGAFSESATLFERALAITEKNLGPDGIETAALLTRYAAVLEAMKRTDEARAAQARAESIRKRVAAL